MQAQRSLRLLLFNLATDADDPVLGFTTTWIRALAERAASIDVISMRAGRFEVPDNVRVFSVGKERGYRRPRRVFEFYRILRGLLARNRYDACFAHMMPLFAVMGAPLLKPRRIPVTLWYVHKSVPLLLRVAEKVVDTIVTASPESFELPTPKVIVTGHGIDTALFTPGPPKPTTSPFTVSSIGRIAPIKRLEVVIEAVRRLVEDHTVSDIEVRFVGPIYEWDGEYAAALSGQIADANLDRLVKFIDPQPQAFIVEEYRRADVVLSLTETGSLDKAVLEAMSCGVPVVTSNAAFGRLLAEVCPDLVVPDGRAEAVARACRQIRNMSEEEKQALGAALREIVVRDHGLDRLADLLTTKILVS